MSRDDVYTGSCFCGAVQLVVIGHPVAMGYCHCTSCREWSSSPVNAFTLWHPDALDITQGASAIGTYHKSANSHRSWCVKCGGHLYTEHPSMGLLDIYAATIPKLAFEPGVHVHYQETVLRIFDGLSKMQDMPAEMGGSGIEVPE